MEFDEIVVKESPGLCRCCLSEGCYKDLGSEYTWMNDTEIYADMLLECFDISISQHNDGPNGPSRLICEVCITRLRDACNFKKQVLDSEKKFVDMIGRGQFGHKVVIYQTTMKCEAVPEEPQVEEGEVEYLEEEMEFVDDEVHQDESAPEPSVSDEITVAALKVKGKRGRPKKTATIVKTEKKAKMARLEEKPRTSKAVSKGRNRRVLRKKKEDLIETEDILTEDSEKEESTESRKKSLTSQERLNVMRKNVLQVLLNSTVMPFKWLKDSYKCFYCYKMFVQPEALKTHNETHTDDIEKEEAMNKHCGKSVYVDISDVSCKLCPAAVDDLYALIYHLVLEHKVEFNQDIGICMEAFKLKSLSVECSICDSKFNNFGHLLVHMNSEHKGCSSYDIQCDLCGKNFKSTQHLRDHIAQRHEKKSAKCSKCNLVLSTHNRLRTHLQKYHDKTYKCFYCPEKFMTHYRRTSHIKSVHKSSDLVKCPHCPLTFVFRSIMRRHVRELHLQEKNAVCQICGKKTFGEGKLKNHMRRHSNEKNFKCQYCDKAFKTSKTMRQHVQNIHEKIERVEDELLADEAVLMKFKH